MLNVRWNTVGSRLRNGTTLLFAALLVLASVLALLPAGAPYLLDDYDQLPYVRSFDSALETVIRPDCYGFFRPVKNVCFYIVAYGGRLEPVWRHGLVWALYVLACVLFVHYTQHLFRRRRWAVICALVWALAPTQVSALAWLSCINIVAMAVALVGGLLLYEAAETAGTPKGIRSRTVVRSLAGAAFFLAVLSYEGAVMFPALLVVHDMARGRRLSRQGLARYGAFGVVALAAVTLRVVASAKMVTGGDGFSPVSAGQTTFASAYFFLDHLALWLAPLGRQEILGTFVWGRTVPVAVLVLAWLVLLGVVAMAFLLRRRAPLIGCGLLWFVVAFAPMSNLVPLNNGPVADYYLVVPSMGLALALTAMARRVFVAMRGVAAGSAWRKGGLAVLVVLGLWRGGLAIVAFEWAQTWHRPAVLLQRSMAAGPFPFRARANLARMMKNAGLLDNARALAQRTADEAPWYDLAHNVLGDIAVRQERYPAACDHYERAIDAAPQRPYPYFALAYVQETHRDAVGPAVRRYRQVLALPWNSYSRTAALNAARLLGRSGHVDAAIDILEAALEHVPEADDLRHNLRVARRQKKGKENE